MKNIKTKNQTLAGAGLLAAFAASLCCITPLLALVAGMGGIASSLSFLEPLRPLFIAVTVLVLGFAWTQQLKSKKEIECDCETDEKKSFLQTKMFLGIVTVLAALLLSFPYYLPLFYAGNRANAADVSPAFSQRIVLNVKGMSCEGCETAINGALAKTPGVINSESDFQTGRAVVTYDTTRLTESQIKSAIESVGYKVVDN